MTERTTIQRTTNERDIGALLLRLTVGGLMLFHGIDKITGGISWMPGGRWRRRELSARRPVEVRGRLSAQPA